MTAKEQVRHILSLLPDDCTLDDVVDRLDFVMMLEDRIASADDPHTRMIPHEEVAQRMREKWDPRLAGTPVPSGT